MMGRHPSNTGNHPIMPDRENRYGVFCALLATLPEAEQQAWRERWQRATQVDMARRNYDVEVRIFTARVCVQNGNDTAVARRAIRAWCRRHIGMELPITNFKDFGMIELWDDRAITVEQNTGRQLAGEQPRFSP